MKNRNNDKKKVNEREERRRRENYKQVKEDGEGEEEK